LRPEVRVEVGVTRMQVRVPCIQIGDYLALSRAMHLANVQTFGPNVWRPNRVLSVPQIDVLSVCADRKMVNLYVYLCNFTKKS
jgi:hypothetical protein